MFFKKFFRLIVSCILLFFVFTSPLAFAQSISYFPLPADQVKKMGPGINGFSYDPLWRRGTPKITSSHLIKIYSSGFRTFRVNLMAFEYMDDDFKISEVWLKRLDKLLDDLLRIGFTVILDEHDFESCREDVVLCDKKLVEFWRQISVRYRFAPPSVIFEIMNEPSRSVTPRMWNYMFPKSLSVIRRTNLQRNVIVGPAQFNSIDALDLLQLPRHDRHIIVGIHYYYPLEFTHQGFPSGNWFPGLPLRGWGSNEDRLKVDQDFSRADKWAQRENRSLFLGEFGSYERAPNSSRAAYARYVARSAEKYGWAWAYWQFDKSFSLYDISTDVWNNDIVNALLN